MSNLRITSISFMNVVYSEQAEKHKEAQVEQEVQ